MEARLENTIHTLILTGILAAGCYAASAGAAEVYRWVDENGEVHYSESLPPDYKDKGYDVLNRDGLVIEEDQSLTPEPPPEVPPEEERQELPRDASGLPRPKAPYSEAEMQQRMDNFLMLRYESEQEITDAMNVEIKQLNYDRRLLEGSRASTEAAYRGQLRVAAERQLGPRYRARQTTARTRSGLCRSDDRHACHRAWHVRRGVHRGAEDSDRPDALQRPGRSVLRLARLRTHCRSQTGRTGRDRYRRTPEDERRDRERRGAAAVPGWDFFVAGRLWRHGNRRGKASLPRHS